MGELFKVILVGTGVQLKLRKYPNAYIAINPCETSVRMNFNVIDKKQLI
jgi:hypothetical protein